MTAQLTTFIKITWQTLIKKVGGNCNNKGVNLNKLLTY